MTKRVYKAQVIAKLEAMEFDRAHTLRKTWMLKNGQERRGWWIANFHGWQLLGDTLTEVMDNLELREEMIEWERS